MPDMMLILGALAAAIVVLSFISARTRVGRARSQDRSEPSLHRRTLIRIGATFMLLFAGIVWRIVYVSLIGARQVSERSGQDEDGQTLSNARRASQALAERRGSILDRNGHPLVESERSGDRWLRTINVDTAPHVLGYFSPLRFGLSGLEASRDGDLAGSDPLTFEEAMRSLLFRVNAKGHDIVSTIDQDLQALAADLLANVTGSAVLLDVETGEILAMASSPGFDAGSLVTNSPDDSGAAAEAWTGITNQPDQPLLFRATTGLYPPGSTFKVLTAAAGIDSGAIGDSTVFVDDGSLEVDGRIIPEFNRPDETRTEWTVRDGLVWSLNVVYAQIGLELGADTYRRYANAFGIGKAFEFEFGIAPGQVAAAPEDLDNPVALADTAFGQGALLVTPLHMARVMMAVANGGRIVRPRLVREVLSADGERIWQGNPVVDANPITAATAATVLDMLYDSASFGYAAAAATPGLLVAAKTGTAESGREAPHGWFIGAAGVDRPQLAVSVCLDYGGEGGGLALQIGRALLEAGTSR